MKNALSSVPATDHTEIRTSRLRITGVAADASKFRFGNDSERQLQPVKLFLLPIKCCSCHFRLVVFFNRNVDLLAALIQVWYANAVVWHILGSSDESA
jgi:hypothetical protein